MGLETERKRMIDGLMAELHLPSPNITVKHNCKVSGARGCDDGEGVEVLGEGGSLGVFDFFVDASGVASSARGARFRKPAFYTGITLLQGLVKSPEKVSIAF